MINKWSFAVVISVISLILIVLCFQGCSLKLYPIRNTDEQMKLMTELSIDSYKRGLMDAISAMEDYEDEAQTLPNTELEWGM